MVFRPNMSAFTEGIRAVAPLRWRAWNGTVADLWEAHGAPDGLGHYLSPDPRLVVFLGDGDVPIRLGHRLGDATPCRVAFVPAGLPLWSRMVEASSFRHLDLHFDGSLLDRRFEGRTEALRRPVLLDGHPDVEHLARMIAEEVAAPTRDDLVPEALATAALSLVLGLPKQPEAVRAQGGLAPAQVRRVTELMRADLHRKISVAELAAAAGLSESWFAHAFPATTGMSPARYLMGLRIEAAQRLLRDGDRTIGEVASATGFADQTHLTRAFRRATGTTPAAWRRLAQL